MTYIYSYRLTHFGGTAPCFDDGLMTLAICKRDMRRVIGNLYNSEEFKKYNDEIWFLGIVGNTLANKKEFKDYKDRVIYAAKVTDVKEFYEYFADVSFKNRADVIYKKTHKKTELKSGDEFFEHKGSEIHNDSSLQKRDFDVGHKNSKKYVLISKCYSFINSDDDKGIKTIISDKGKWPTGVGHRRVDDKNNELGKILSGLVKKGKNESVLPTEIKGLLYDKKGCGKKGGNA